MISAEQNATLTRVGPGTPMGELLRRYWHPIAGVSEFDTIEMRPIRLFGEDLVLYKDLSGNFGLIDRQCAHRRADMSYGMTEARGLRCNYHGWAFDHTGACVSQPYEDTTMPEARTRERVKIKAYPVQAMAGMLWAYMGPQPAPLLPEWEAFTWKNGFSQVVLSELPCNWFQCQENSIDPVHFEWMHENWSLRLRGEDSSKYAPTHTRLAFEEFEYGLIYKRIKSNTSERDGFWTVGRICLWPNAFFLGGHFEWRVPIDDENTLSVTWKFTRVPREREPYVQQSIPTWWGPLYDDSGKWISTHVMNQDFLAWVGQGRIADRTKETLGASDRGIAMLRARLFQQLRVIEQGGEPMGLVRDPAKNHAIALPNIDRAMYVEGFTTEQILSDPRRRMTHTTYVLQAGQPEHVRRAMSEAMGIEQQVFDGKLVPRASVGAGAKA